jgi:hypothetical protein
MKRAALLALVFAGCAQGPTLQERLTAWVGRDEGDLVAAFGVPVRTYQVEGRRFLEFEQRRAVPVAAPDPWFGGPWGPRRGYWPAPPGEAIVACSMTFELREHRVEAFSFRGQGCA